MDDRRKRLLGWLGVGWLVLAFVAVIWVVGSQTDDLQTKAEAALAGAGLNAVVDVDGRDATLTGDLTGADRERALEIVENITGIRRVDWDEASAGPSFTTTTAPSTTTSTTPDSTTTTTSDTTTTTIAPATASELLAQLDNGRLVLSGSIPDAAAAGRTAAVADLIYFPFLEGEVMVDGDRDSNSWIGGAGDAIAVLPIVNTATLEIRGEVASLTAIAPSDEAAATLTSAVQAALGQGVELQTDYEISGKVPPFYDAIAPGDGTVTIDGVMPDQAAIDRILDAAVAVFGEDNVVNEMSVGDDTDTTFSLFRIPLTFQQFAPIEEWQVKIENNVTSGKIRGGASFQFASAELTPELVNLLDIAAGILLRNPTIFMTIEGHTDSVGPDSVNQTLSEARAAAAVNYLIGQGVPAERLAGIGYGETRPIGDNGTAAGRESNRRIEFLMGPPEGAS